MRNLKVSRQWDSSNPGVLKYMKGGEEPEAVGVFWENWGWGHLYLPNGTVVWTCWTEACALGAEQGFQVKRCDPLRYYTGVYLGD